MNISIDIAYVLQLLTSAIIGALITILVYEFLPASIKYRLSYGARWLIKWIQNKSIPIVVRWTMPVEFFIQREQLVDKLKHLFFNENVKLHEEGDYLRFSFKYGQDEIDGTISFDEKWTDDGKAIVLNLIVRIEKAVNYRTLMEEIMEVQSGINERIIIPLSKVLGTRPVSDISCKLSGLPQLTGFIKDLNIQYMLLDSKYKIKFGLDQITVMEIFDKNTLSLLRVFVTLYG